MLSLFQERINGCQQICFWHCSACAPEYFTITKQYKGGYRLNAVAICCCAVFVDVHFNNANAVAQSLLHLLQDGVHHFAGLAPCGKKVSQNKLPAVDYIVECFHNHNNLLF